MVVYECSSISTLEWCGITWPGERKMIEEDVRDQAWFCVQVAGTNKLELLKWAREVKHCEWNAMTITAAALKVISRC